MYYACHINLRRFTYIVATALLFLAVDVHAASLYLAPQTKTPGANDTISVDVIINSDDQSINAAQATVSFPTDILEIVSVDTSGSIFNFWVEEPHFSNENGTLRFVGGSPKGKIGDALTVLRMRVKVRGVGNAQMSLSQAVVTANDGKGTNILTSMAGTNVTIGTQDTTPKSEEVVQEPAEEVIQPAPKPKPVILPKRVERAPVRSSSLPDKPKLEVPLYPDQESWYNHIGDVIALWEVPEDVVQVATRLSQTTDTKPGDKEEELFTGKNFDMLENEGIWFVRAQFRNNRGWGPLEYYKIQLDTTPPLAFNASVNNALSDNPRPTVQFSTNDSLSGISHAMITVDDEEAILYPITSSTADTLTLPAQNPGNHSASIKIFDHAGNYAESIVEFEILPLPTPTITYITPKISEGELLYVSGKTISGGFVKMYVLGEGGKQVAQEQVEADSSGNWSITIDDLFSRGNYQLVISAYDSRGAISHHSNPVSFEIKPRIVISFGFVDLSWFEILIASILLFSTILAIIAVIYVNTHKTRSAYNTIASRDVNKMADLIESDLKVITQQTKKITGKTNGEKTGEITHHIKSIQTTLGKMRKYLGKELDKIK